MRAEHPFAFSRDVIPAKHREAVREPGPTEPLAPWVPDSRYTASGMTKVEALFALD
jgi:hypothetical protein